jgi:hypothetical protein
MKALLSNLLKIGFFLLNRNLLFWCKKISKITRIRIWRFGISLNKLEEIFCILLIEKYKILTKTSQIFFYIFKFRKRKIFETCKGFFLEIPCNIEITNALSYTLSNSQFGHRKYGLRYKRMKSD